jgi:hypothetical protein
MDRFSWASTTGGRLGGRWEWHFCWAEDQAKGGYPGREWYNPFTGSQGFAPYAPPSYPGGMLFQSMFLDVAEGITDYAYLVTLEKALADAAAAGKESPAVREARQFLEARERQSRPSRYEGSGNRGRRARWGWGWRTTPGCKPRSGVRQSPDI